jgi:hypothetical protein
MTEPPPRPRGRPPLPEGAKSRAAVQRAYREQRKAEAKPVVVRDRRPAEWRSKPRRWQDAVETLRSIMDTYQGWRADLPAGLVESEFADRLDALLELRDAVEQLDAAELPKGLGRA